MWDAEFVAFKHAFGEVRMQAHFPSFGSFLRAAAPPSSSASGDRASGGGVHLHLACAAYDAGIAAKEFFEEHFGTGMCIALRIFSFSLLRLPQQETVVPLSGRVSEGNIYRA